MHKSVKKLMCDKKLPAEDELVKMLTEKENAIKSIIIN